MHSNKQMKKFHRFRRINSLQVFGCAVEKPKMVRTAAAFRGAA
jgi:hypothetical protein